MENLCRLHSDHCPILIRCGGLLRPKGERPFRFQAAWSTHFEYRSVVQNAWSKGRPNALQSLHEVRLDSKAFNSEVFRNIFRRKRKIEEKIKHIQARLAVIDSLELRKVEKEL